MKYQLIFWQSEKSPYFLGQDRIFSLEERIGSVLRLFDQDFIWAFTNELDSIGNQTIGFVIESVSVEGLALALSIGVHSVSEKFDQFTRVPFSLIESTKTDKYTKLLHKGNA